MTEASIVASSAASQARSESEDRLRNRLLFKLGVGQDGAQATRREPSRGSLLGNVRIQSEPLKGNDDGDEADGFRQNSIWDLSALFRLSSSSSSPPTGETDAESSSSAEDSQASSSNNNTTRNITFNEEVSVCLIPKREEYSKRIRKHLWLSPQELATNAQRNTIEFASESWNWQKALEDDEMYRCIATNELIHPVHVERHQAATKRSG